MFVKDAYQQRLKQEESTHQRAFKINKAPVIGSTKNDKINYDRDQQFFSKEDVPFRARQIKDSVKNFIDPDHLGLRKRQWNSSVSVPKKLESEETHEQRLLKIKLGFLDHPLPKYKEGKIYEGTDTRNDYTKWNVSNEVSRKDMKENFQKTTLLAFENTKVKQKQFLTQYNDPLHKTTNFITSFKKDWQSKEDLRNDLKNKYIFDNPTASDEKINAAVFRLAYETGIKKKKDDIEALAMKTDFKATLSQTQKSRMHLKFNHTGSWQPLKIGSSSEETWVWSCCLNEQKDSRGCVYRLKDGNKWNLSSFNA